MAFGSYVIIAPLNPYISEVLESLGTVIERRRKYCDARILERIVKPERRSFFASLGSTTPGALK